MTGAIKRRVASIDEVKTAYDYLGPARKSLHQAILKTQRARMFAERELLVRPDEVDSIAADLREVLNLVECMRLHLVDYLGTRGIETSTDKQRAQLTGTLRSWDARERVL